jgi:osmotically-inducible protein OsmY
METDSQLQLDVIDELKWEPGLDHENVGVSVNKGVVTLSGTVKSFSEKLLAENTARRVKGVRAIAEDLMVRYDWQPKTGDTEIAKRVADVFEWNSLIPSERIKVTVEDGVVKLEGKVDWNYQKDLAFKDASKIGGVIRIDNRIRVIPSVQPGDVRERIEEAFERQADLEAENIQVRAEGGKVILSGRVSSWAKRSLAEKAAWSAPGVGQVEDARLIVSS